MKIKNDGGQAFPYNTAWGTPGMTLRDWFAGQVIAGHFHIDPAVQYSYAQTAYTMADAMLAARDK